MNRRDFIKFTTLAVGGAISIGDFLLAPKQPRMVWVSVRVKDGNQWDAMQALFTYKLIREEQLESLYRLRLKNRSMLIELENDERCVSSSNT